jgi:hypothetical protein
VTDPQIRITVDGKLALTTAQAAQEFGVEPVTVRTGIRDLSIEPVAHLDARTPLYAAVGLRRAWKARPGRGVNLRKPRAAS